MDPARTGRLSPTAEADFRKALELAPDTIEPLYGLGMSLKLQGRNEDALKAFDSVLKRVREGAGEADPARTSMLRNMAAVQTVYLREGLTQEPPP